MLPEANVVRKRGNIRMVICKKLLQLWLIDFVTSEVWFEIIMSSRWLCWRGFYSNWQYKGSPLLSIILSYCLFQKFGWSISQFGKYTIEEQNTEDYDAFHAVSLASTWSSNSFSRQINFWQVFPRASIDSPLYPKQREDLPLQPHKLWTPPTPHLQMSRSSIRL